MELIYETPRLKLIKFTDVDHELLFKLTGNEQVMKHFPKVLTPEETKNMIHKILTQYKEYNYCFWKVLIKPSNHFIGIAGLLNQHIEDKHETEISYRILPEYWNKGYATEAAKACKDYAIKNLGKSRLISIIEPSNVASIRVASKLGAIKEKSINFMGAPHDVYVY